jgi:hypothetical protein
MRTSGHSGGGLGSAVALASILFGAACAPAAPLASDTLRPRPAPGLGGGCSGCQASLANGCVRVLGAAADRIGVTIARTCEPWCCVETRFDLGQGASATYVRPAGSADCPHLAPAVSTTAVRMSPTPGAIRGRVTEERGAFWVPRATVVVSSPASTFGATSDAAGSFYVAVPASTYTLTVYYGDTVFKRQCIVVAPAEAVWIDVDLDPDIAQDSIVVD